MLIPIEPEEYKYVWCLHCERVGLATEWLRLDECPYCGATPLDAFAWTTDDWPREGREEDYPEEPTLGGWYPLDSPRPEEAHLVGQVPDDHGKRRARK